MPRTKKSTTSKSKPNNLVIHVEDYGGGPIFLSQLRGTPSNPIIIKRKKKKTILRHEKENPQLWASLIAYKRQEAGFYPSIGQTGDDAALVLKDCQYVQIEGLEFENFWPTAIYLDQCQNIIIRKCTFKNGTIGIGANGGNTRDLLIEECEYSQSEQMWKHFEWAEIHGSFANNDFKAEIGKGKHQFDGDFFRGWDIIGNVTFRKNTIRDCFNGIHFFNRTDGLPAPGPGKAPRYMSNRKSTVNVLIEDNLFERVRDNCVEPEDFAWNFVIRGNRFANCYLPYSFEFERAGWFYIYDNHHWLIDRPGGNTNQSGGGFKVKGTQANDGLFYIFNNSWLFGRRERYFRKGRLGQLRHFNNVIVDLKGGGRSFGTGSRVPDPIDSTDEARMDREDQRFTRRWAEYGIVFDGDWIYDGASIVEYRAAGYPLGASSRDDDPGIADPRPSNPKKKNPSTMDYSLVGRDELKSAGAPWQMIHPSLEEAIIPAKQSHILDYRLQFDAGKTVGAGMTATERKRVDEFLTFVPGRPF